MKTMDYSAIRYEGETALVDILEEGFALKNYYGLFDNEEELRDVVNSLRRDAVKLNRIIAPRLYEICSTVKTKLSYDEDIDFYVMYDVSFNAFSINGFGFFPHMIVLNSALIQFFTDDELAFVIGHEIGHLIYKHTQLRVASSLLEASKKKSVPAQVQNTLTRWWQYAEISSDRIGFIAQPNLETIGKVFFKLTSGLSEEHLKFDIKEYLKQLDNLKSMSYGDFYASHPNNLVRLKSLELFSQSDFFSLVHPTSITKDDLRIKTQEVLDLLEYHPRTEDQKKAVEFIASVGTYVVCANRDMNPKEMEVLYNMLARYTSQPENYLGFNEISEVIDRKNAICEYYAHAKNDYKFYLFSDMVYLSICDGRLDDSEKTALLEIAERLQIDEDRAKRTILDISNEYMRPQHDTVATPKIGNLFQGN